MIWEANLQVAVFNIPKLTSTSKMLNLQANSCNVIQFTRGCTKQLVTRASLYSNPQKNMTQAHDMIDSAHTTAIYAMRATVATTLGSTPSNYCHPLIPFC